MGSRNIKEAEEETGITRQNIRFYEKKGLIQPERNKENDYRQYSEEDIQRLKTIKMLRKLDFSVEDIKEVLEGNTDFTQAVRNHLDSLKERKRELSAQINFLEKMEREGADLSNQERYLRLMEQEELIIIFDDISLEPGQLRIRKKGSAGGHNGIKSIIAHLGTQEFTRIKVGVGEKPPKMDLADYVLGHFLKEEQDTMKQAFENAAGAAAAIVTQGADAAMNLYNGSKKKSEKKTEKSEEKKSEEKKAEEKTAEGKKPEVQTPGTGASSAS